jgi:hypothetical protein
MLIQWTVHNNKVVKIEITPENGKEKGILTALKENEINLNHHLLLATKEKPSPPGRITTQLMTHEITIQEHL